MISSPSLPVIVTCSGCLLALVVGLVFRATDFPWIHCSTRIPAKRSDPLALRRKQLQTQTPLIANGLSPERPFVAIAAIKYLLVRFQVEEDTILFVSNYRVKVAGRIRDSPIEMQSRPIQPTSQSLLQSLQTDPGSSA